MINAGIIGLGRWGQNLVNSIQGKSEKIRVVAGATRTRAKEAVDYAAKQSFPLVDSAVKLFSDPKIDAVIVATPHTQRVELITAAARAGKHVLCEKPLATKSAQARLMAAAADANDRLLVEAVWTRWHPRFSRMVEIVRGGELGELRSIESAFTFPGNFVDNYRTTPEYGGGSLLDVGPYQVHTWVALRGIDSQFNVLELDRNIGPTGIDMTTQVTGHLSSAESARMEVRALASFERPEQQRLVVTGSLKQIECVGNEAFTSWNSASALRIGDRQEDFAPIDPFQVMLQDFGSRISGEAGWLPELSESIRVMEILDQIRLAPPGA